MEGKVDVSVILCAYNEEDIIQKTLDEVNRVLMKTDWNYEIILVDDGSLDDTKKKAIEYRYKKGIDYLKVVSYEKNLGKGNAIKVGFEHSKGDFIVVMDGDLDIDPSYIPHYVEALQWNDVAVSSKWHPESHVSITLMRKFLSLYFNALSRLLTGIKLRDTQTGLKAFRRSVLKRIIPKLVVRRFAFDLELLVACNHCGFKIMVLPVNVRIRSIIAPKEILRMVFDLFRIAYRLKNKYYQLNQKEIFR